MAQDRAEHRAGQDGGEPVAPPCSSMWSQAARSATALRSGRCRAAVRDGRSRRTRRTCRPASGRREWRPRSSTSSPPVSRRRGRRRAAPAACRRGPGRSARRDPSGSSHRPSVRRRAARASQPATAASQPSSAMRSATRHRRARVAAVSPAAARMRASAAGVRAVVRTSCPCSSSWAMHQPATNPVPPVTRTVMVLSFVSRSANETTVASDPCRPGPNRRSAPGRGAGHRARLFAERGFAAPRCS